MRKEQSVRLEPMNDETFSLWSEASVKDYAAGKVRSGAWAEAGALERSREERAKLLPQGRNTPQHHFFDIVDSSSSTSLGHLWVAQGPFGEPMEKAWVFDVEVKPPFRNQGWGRAAFHKLEALLPTWGVRELGLHVFGWNSPAIALYQTLGFETVGIVMRKPLRPTDAESNQASR